MCYLTNRIKKCCERFHILIHLYLCQWNPVLSYHYFSMILDNICIFLLNNILADYLVKDMYTIVNPWHFCNQCKHRVLFLFNIYQNQDKGHILFDSELKLCARCDTYFFLLQYSILKIIFVLYYFQICMLYVSCILKNITPFLVLLIFFVWN